MYLTHRSTQPKDFEACFKLMHNRFVFTKTKTEKTLKSLWDQTLREGTALSSVIEDQNRPRGKKIIALGFSVFVTNNFINDLKTSLPAYPALQVLRSLKRGQRPFLTLSEIARQNGTEGLNSLTLFYGWDKRLSEADQNNVKLNLMDAFHNAHCGWKLQRFCQEVYGPVAKAAMEGMGMKLLRDYRESPPRPHPPANSQPYLYWSDRNERRFLEGDYLFAQVFNYTPPRFRFSAGEKEILGQALEGKIDLEIAKAFHLSIWTVKKRWQGIYRKVDIRDPSLLKSDRSSDEVPKETPDLQRRRRLLEFLRHHMEEVRPILEPRRRS